LNLDVYDVTNTTLQGTLSQAFSVGFLEDLLSPSFGMFMVDAASSADIALLQPRRVVRFRTGASAGTGDVFACVVQDRPASSQSDVELASGATVATVSFECPDLWDGWLGGSTGGAVLYPFGGLDGRQQNPRLFGPFAADFDDSGWGSPTIGAAVSTPEWPDDRAVAFEFAERAWYRRFMPAAPSEIGAARIYVAATWRTQVDVYLDGELALTKPAGQTGIFYVDAPYEDRDHQIAIHAVNEGATGRVAFTWVRLVETTDDDGNEVLEPGGVLRRTFDPVDFPDAQEPWYALEDYVDEPGVNVGYVMDVALTEADDRSHAPLPTWDFDGDGDSGSSAWDVTFSRGFRMQELGKLLEELTSIEGEPEITPAGLLRLWKRRGEDRSGTVTVADAPAFGLSGRGPQATRWLYETEGGMGDAVNAAAESALGVRMEQFVQLGTDISPDGIGPALVAQLVADGQVRDEVEFDVPASLTPYDDFFVGDTITVGARDGSTQTVRVLSVGYERLDANGEDRWTVTAVPYTEPA
jgi:hypothetical protein